MQQQFIASVKQMVKINLFKNTNQQNKTFIIMNKLKKIVILLGLVLCM